MTSANADEAFSVVYPIAASYAGRSLKDEVSVSLASSNPVAFSWNKNFASTPKYWYVLLGTANITIALDNVSASGGNAYAFDPSTGNAATADIIIYAEGN